MTKHALALVLLAVGFPAMASAVCTAPTTAANLLVGQKWAFQLVNPPVVAPPYTGGQRGAVGVFTGYAGGWVNFVESLNLNGNIIRLANTWGQWTGLADCTGGTLKFQLYYVSYTFNFTITGAGTMSLVLTDERYAFGPPPPPLTPQKALTGMAVLLSPVVACPITVSSSAVTNLLNGKKYDYQLDGAGFKETGRFSGYIWNPAAYSGALSIDRKMVTAPGDVVLANLIGSGGRYIIYSDCSGGELLFNANGLSRQLEFVFTKSDFSQMYIVEDGLGNPVVTGIANKVP
jgi:hypothetical protein